MDNLNNLADHFWNFEEQVLTTIKDRKTNKQIISGGENLKATRSPQGNQAISIRDQMTRVDLNLAATSCLHSPFTCTSGLTVAMVIKLGAGTDRTDIFGACGIPAGMEFRLCSSMY